VERSRPRLRVFAFRSRAITAIGRACAAPLPLHPKI